MIIYFASFVLSLAPVLKPCCLVQVRISQEMNHVLTHK